MASEPLFIHFWNWYESHEKLGNETIVSDFSMEEAYREWAFQCLKNMGWDEIEFQKRWKAFLKSIRSRENRDESKKIYETTVGLFRAFKTQPCDMKLVNKLWSELIKFGEVEPLPRPTETTDGIGLRWDFAAESPLHPGRAIAFNFYLYLAKAAATAFLGYKENIADQTQSAISRIQRCRQCNRWFLRAETIQGPPKVYCSISCKSVAAQRAYRQRLKEKLKPYD